LFADFLHLRRGIILDESRDKNITKTKEYRGYLLALTLVPIHLLWFKVQQVQLIYAVMGAFFMPLLALTLLLLNAKKN
jgi:hypothetical protein